MELLQCLGDGTIRGGALLRCVQHDSVAAGTSRITQHMIGQRSDTHRKLRFYVRYIADE